MQAQPTEAQIDVAKRLETAIRMMNSELVESAVPATFPTPHRIQAPALILLAEASWDHRHEDVVLALQDLRCPDAVGALERTTFSVHEYLANDEHFGLARKCIWALADIGTPEAQQALKRIANCNNPTIAGYARKRLDNWQKELPRKGVKL